MKVVYLGRSTRRGSLPEPGVDGDSIELFENNWDDYGNKTTFGTSCRIAGEEVELGYIKLMVDGHASTATYLNQLRETGWNGGFPLPILIENTAGGNNAMTRRFDRVARLWDAIGEFGPGFCLDTCHAYAGGEELAGIVDRVRAITGRIDLVHANSSRDAFDSGADRHANFDAGMIEPETIASIVREAGSDALVETPREGQRADIDFLRAELGIVSVS